MVEKVTKEEKAVELTKKAAEKAIEILNANDFNEEDLSGEEVKVKRPKKKPAEEKVEVLEYPRDVVGKGDPNYLGAESWKQPSPYSRKPQKDYTKEGYEEEFRNLGIDAKGDVSARQHQRQGRVPCEWCGREAEWICTACGKRACQLHYQRHRDEHPPNAWRRIGR